MRRLRALAALLLLAALIAGVPLVLATTIGNPLDSWDAVKAGDVSSQVVIDLLAAVVWLCWAQFAAATVLEGWSTARHITLPEHVPLVYGGGRALARTLIVTAFMLGPVLGATITAPAAHAAPPHATPPPHLAAAARVMVADAPTAEPTLTAAHTVPPPAARAATTTEVVIRAEDGPRTYWDLAATHLGDGQRWHEIWALNQGRRQPDGTVMSSPNLLRPGWTVLLPAAAGSTATGGQVLVHAGDTLSGLAAEQGLPSWAPLWQANANRAEPGGEQFTDPDLIKPGWMFSMPATARPPGAQGTPPVPAPPPPARPAAPSTRPNPSPAAPHGPPSNAGHPAADGPARAATPPPGAPIAPQRVNHAAAAASSGRHPGHAASSAHTAEQVAMFAGGGGALLAGVSWLALTAYRRRQFRFRRPGRAIQATPVELVDLEKELLAAGMTGVPDVTWLNQAARSLVHSTAIGEDGRLPDLLAVRMNDDILELVLAAPHTRPPEPWQSNADGTRWTVRHDDPLPFDPAEVVFHFAPYPTLSTLGHTADGDVWLVDLERIGALTLTGAMDRCLDLARALAAELAHNVWSEQLQVTLVGFGQQMAELNPARLTYNEDLEQLIDTVRVRMADVLAAGAQQHVDALDSRLRNTAGEVWAPHVVLIAPTLATDRAELDRLLAVLRDQQQRTALAVVLADETSPTATTAPWTAQLDADGTLHLPALDLTLSARQVAESEAGRLTQLMVQCAATTDRPMPQARGRQPWDSYTDVTGALLPQVTIARDQALPPAAAGPGDVPALQSVTTGASRSVLPLPDEMYLKHAAVVEADMDALAPGVSAEVRKRVEDDNATLDQDLADWHSEHADRPKLQLLGPVRLTLPGWTDAKRPPRLAMSTEVIAFLASRRNGATVTQVGAALWPHDRDILDKTLPKQKVSAARRLLGRNPRTGRGHIPHGAGGIYHVEDILIDAELCRRLHARGSARGADGTPDLWQALQLVTGVPFDQRREGGYEWLLDTPLDSEYLAMIVDISSKVVAHELARGDPAAAMRAAQVPLKAGSSDDTVLLNMMSAHDAAGDRAAGDECVKQILASFDVEEEVDLPPRTAEILRRRQYS